MSWHLAPALVQLRDECNRLWPNRDRASDGTIGDERHQKESQSDHNPDANGSVNAWDVDVDGIDVPLVLSRTIGNGRVEYVIWNRKIWTRTNKWVPKPYYGLDPHTGHVHISVRHGNVWENDTTRWFVNVNKPGNKPANQVKDRDMVTAIVLFYQMYLNRVPSYAEQVSWFLAFDGMSDKQAHDEFIKSHAEPGTVTAAYALYLHRVPSLTEIGEWSDTESVSDVFNGVKNSVEAQNYK